jgi:hypothetical protein
MAGALGSCPLSGTGQAFRRNDEGNAEGGFAQNVILSVAKNLSYNVRPFASLRVTLKSECKT